MWKSLACLRLRQCQPGRPFQSAGVAGAFSLRRPAGCELLRCLHGLVQRLRGRGAAGLGSSSPVPLPQATPHFAPRSPARMCRDHAESPGRIPRVPRVRVLSREKSRVHRVSSKQFPDAPLKSGSPEWEVEGRKERGWGAANRPHKTGPKIGRCFAEGAYGKNTTCYRRKCRSFEEFYIQPTNSAVD